MDLEGSRGMGIFGNCRKGERSGFVIGVMSGDLMRGTSRMMGKRNKHNGGITTLAIGLMHERLCRILVLGKNEKNVGNFREQILTSSIPLRF
jgi:hypothetical protein